MAKWHKDLQPKKDPAPQIPEGGRVTAKPGGKKAGGLGGFWGGLGRRNKILAGVAGGLCAATLLGILVLALTPRVLPAEAPSISLPAALSGPASAINVEALPDKIEEAAFVGTILPESADAGMAYCEETLFLGDSNTERMLAYNDITGVGLQNGIGVVSMGIQTFTTSACVRFSGHSKSYTMPQAVGVLKPRRVVITFGSNNVGMNLETFVSYYEAGIKAVRESYPYADIIIGSIFPVDQYRQNTSMTMGLIDKMNVALASLARQTETKFLNWSEALLDEEIGYCGFEYTLQDGVHLTRAGMTAIFDYFRTHSYVTEDERPPTGSIPQRMGIMPGLILKDPGKIPGPIDWSKYADSSSKEEGGVRVQITAWDDTNGVAGGGTVSAGGSSGGSVSLTASPGDSISVSATAKSGYQFVGWTCSVGSAGGASGATLSYTVPGDSEGPISITAVFKVAQPKPSSSSDSSSSSSSGSDASTPAPSSVPSSPDTSQPPVTSAPSVPDSSSSEEQPESSSPPPEESPGEPEGGPPTAE